MLAARQIFGGDSPPPGEADWLLLTDNRQELTHPVLETGVVYWCDPMPDGPRDKIGDEAQTEYQFEGLYTEGQRLLDNDTPSPSWHTVAGWGPVDRPIVITFDLKGRYEITRVDVQLMGDDGQSNSSPESIPESVLYFLNDSDQWENDSAWKDAGETEINPEDIPDWVSSQFAAAPARFVRLEIIPKLRRTVYVREVRIWGRKL